MSVSIAEVQVEHHESGFGISHTAPRLSWRFGPTTAKDWSQASYEVVVSRNGKDEQYKVDSAESVLVPWPSKPLSSRESATVKVRAIGKDGTSTDWKEAKIELGLLEEEQWKGELISCPRRQVDEPKRPFRVWKEFKVDKAGRARLYATAHGLYEATLNGKRIGDQVLAPGWQSYNHYLAYQIYDVTDLLVSGTNVLGAYVGEGWYATRLGRPGERNLWGDRPSFLGQLEVDGNVVVKTDSSWVWADGPVITSEIYDGETVDTRLDNETWWKAKGSPVEVLGKPKGKLVARDAPPVRRLLEVKPKEVITTKSGKKVLDFGQNLVGWVRIDKDFAAKEGSIKIRHAEVMEHGELGVRPLRTAKATDEIILGGKTKGWEPKFTFHGFRYAEVSGVDVDVDSFTAVVVYSDMRRTGTFHSSHSAINQLHSNVVWSMMGNFVSVPTDCPQRDERLGWTGDIQAFAPTANFLFDTAGFLGGWLNDVDAEQRRDHNNIPPEVVPKVTMNKRPVRPMAIWADVVALTPWDLYEAFGDEHLLSQQWESMCLWLDKGLPRRSTGLWDHRAVQYGDWLDPRAPPQLPAHGLTDTHLAADAYLVWTTGIVAKIAHVLGKEAEAKRWDKNYADVLREFRLEYVSANGRLVSDTQTAIALALRFGLIEGEKQREHSRERLEYLVRWDAFKISTGFAGTPNILHALADNGLLHLAYRMLQEKDDPSWLYPVGMGATTIWERWNSMLPDGSINPGQMTSFNHYALGAVASFLHAVVGGLSPLEPGYRTALVQPQPGGTITSAKVSYDSPYGPYAVDWTLNGEQLKVKVEVPPNGKAKVVLPGVDEMVGSGTKEYNVKWEGDKRWPPKLLPGPSSIQMPDEYVP